MKLCSVEINNYKGIEHLEMSFHDGINLIIGNNGAGKTSLLNALSVIIETPLIFLSGLRLNPKLENAVRVSTAVVGDVVKQSVEHYPVQLRAELDMMGAKYVCGKELNSAYSNENCLDYKVIHDFKQNFEKGYDLAPLLVFFGADGRTRIEKNAQKNITISTIQPDRIQGYNQALNGKLAYDTIEKWCVQLDYAEYQRKEPIQEYATFQHIVSSFMEIIDDGAINPKLYYSSTAGSLVYSDGKAEKPLYQLSAGYQNVICMIMEIAYRTVLLNPNIGKHIGDLEGIVLMDEPDLHLHPAWQWKILGALRQTFPKIQFIVATHSPIILASAKDAYIQLLKSPNEAVPLGGTYGYSVNDVLAMRQGSADMAPELQDYYNRAEAILDHGDKAELDMLMKEAAEALRANPEAFKGLADFVEVNRWIEED